MIEDDFYKWNEEFMELSECLGIRTYIVGEGLYHLVYTSIVKVWKPNNDFRIDYKVGIYFLTTPTTRCLYAP